MLKGLSVKKVVAVSVVLYLLSLVWNLPASFVWKRMAGQLPAEVTLHGLTGTLWSGHVNRIEVNRVDQGGLRWSWQPMGLLRAAISLDLLWQPRNGNVSAQLHAGMGALTLRDVTGRLDAASMATVNRAPFILGGSWLLDVPLLELKDMEYVGRAEGQLVWESAAGGLPTAMALGTLAADLEGDDGWLVLTLSDRGGPLGLQGNARWRPGQAMALDTRLQARPEAEAGLVGGLSLLGQPDAQGWVRWQAQLQ